MAQEGGIGVIHCNMPVEQQVAQVQKVKRFRNGFIADPVCIAPTMNLQDLEELRQKCGFSGLPVTEDGRMGSKLLGLVTMRDTDFVQDRKSARVTSIMTPADQLTTAKEGVTLSEANDLLRDSRKGKLP